MQEGFKTQRARIYKMELTLEQKTCIRTQCSALNQAGFNLDTVTCCSLLLSVPLQLWLGQVFYYF